jgi:hypothetical protein
MLNLAEDKHSIKPIESIIAAGNTGAPRHQKSQRCSRPAM